MALIRDNHTDRLYPLRAHHTFGRCVERSDTVTSNLMTSRIDLALQWDGLHWTARDLSKNGTWLGDSRLRANAPVKVKIGDQFHLGAPGMPSWELVDDAPPRSSLIGLDEHSPSIELAPFIFLPTQDDPQAVLIYSHTRHSWAIHTMEHDSSQPLERLIEHGDRLSYGGCSWKVFLAETEQATELSAAAANQLENMEFVFDLSLDEENTALLLKGSKSEVDLGERSHHYLLLHLARQRALEAAQGLDTKSQGWVDNEQLKKDLAMDMPHINIMIFRARKQITESLDDALNSETLIERGKGRMRFGCSNFKIYKGDELTYALPTAPPTTLTSTKTSAP